VVGQNSLTPDPDHDGLEYVLERFGAEEEDIATRLADFRAGVELVTPCVRRDNDMPGRKDEDSLAFAAFADIDTSGALKVSGSGGDLQTECGSEWTAYVGGCVYGGDVIEELLTGGPGEERLPERDLDVGDLELLEKFLETDGRDLGVLAGERPGLHAHPKKNGTGILSDLGEAGNVDSRPLDVNGIQVLGDLWA
jgi:hypothetical protein